ncbi:MAG: IS66 family insertion sequence element accessory protein TnpB [Desulfitobacteriaceae bacterium]|nr:IS66 family insertion sequence element accessory protein TnpB [Desulfitobacteriaceae bacterium]
MLKQSGVDRVYLAVGPTDLRKSIDGLSLIVQESFNLDPFSRHLFVFCNRKRDKIKILEWDKNGFWLHYKRLEKNTFRWPDGTEGSSLLIDERQFRWLLDGLSIHQKGAHPDVKERILI